MDHSETDWYYLLLITTSNSMDYRSQKSDLNKFLFLLFTILPAAKAMKQVVYKNENTKHWSSHNLKWSWLRPGDERCLIQVAEYQHHKIEDLCKAGNQQKVHDEDDDDDDNDNDENMQRLIGVYYDKNKEYCIPNTY